MDEASKPPPAPHPFLWVVVFLPSFLVGVETGKALGDWEIWQRLPVVIGASLAAALVVDPA
jgi:hypothetical protein